MIKTSRKSNCASCLSFSASQAIYYVKIYTWFTYRPNDHMQWHRNVQIECIIIKNVHNKKHCDHIQVGQIANFHWFSATF